MDEHFDLGNGNDDQLFFNVSQIGDDSIFKQVSTNGAYDITIGPGLLAQAGDILGPIAADRHIVIISDEHVAITLERNVFGLI